MFLKARGDDVCNVVKNGIYIPTIVINNVEQPKAESSWNNDDKKKILFDKKEKNIFASALRMYDFF